MKKTNIVFLLGMLLIPVLSISQVEPVQAAGNLSISLDYPTFVYCGEECEFTVTTSAMAYIEIIIDGDSQHPISIPQGVSLTHSFTVGSTVKKYRIDVYAVAEIDGVIQQRNEVFYLRSRFTIVDPNTWGHNLDPDAVRHPDNLDVWDAQYEIIGGDTSAISNEEQWLDAIWVFMISDQACHTSSSSLTNSWTESEFIQDYILAAGYLEFGDLAGRCQIWGGFLTGLGRSVGIPSRIVSVFHDYDSTNYYNHVVAEFYSSISDTWMFASMNDGSKVTGHWGRSYWKCYDENGILYSYTGGTNPINYLRLLSDITSLDQTGWKTTITGMVTYHTPGTYDFATQKTNYLGISILNYQSLVVNPMKITVSGVKTILQEGKYMDLQYTVLGLISIPKLWTIKVNSVLKASGSSFATSFTFSYRFYGPSQAVNRYTSYVITATIVDFWGGIVSTSFTVKVLDSVFFG